MAQRLDPRWMPAPCGCLPGTAENGWHETRSVRCERAELEIWARVMQRFREGAYFGTVVNDRHRA